MNVVYCAATMRRDEDDDALEGTLLWLTLTVVLSCTCSAVNLTKTRTISLLASLPRLLVGHEEMSVLVSRRQSPTIKSVELKF